VGHESLEYLSQRIYECHGPSGPNKVWSSLSMGYLPMDSRRTHSPDELILDQDYLFKLAQSVRDLYPTVKDDYLFSLEVSLLSKRTSCCGQGADEQSAVLRLEEQARSRLGPRPDEPSASCHVRDTSNT
jgi:hypothetical protein